MTNADHISQSSNKKRKRKESGDSHHDCPNVALEQLQLNSLRRYKRHYKLQTRQGLNKFQLVETVSRHFQTMQVNEKEVLTYFIYMVKMKKNRVDSKESTTMNNNHSDEEKKDSRFEK